MKSSLLSLVTLPLLLLAGCSDDGSAADGFSPGSGAPAGTDGLSTGGSGDTASGGSFASGGAATGGEASAGGSGGTVGSGGTGGAVVAADCAEADLQVCSNEIAQHCGLTYEFWSEGPGNGCMVNTASGFTAEWTKTADASGNGPEFNYLARKGVRPGSKDVVLSFAADYQPEGVSYLSVYGWTTDPLIEYYVVESWNAWNPASNADEIGSFESDGGTYKIYRTERVDKPSIQGTATFWQFWSIRQEERTSGTITLSKHFEEWEKNGLVLGDFYEVSFVAEGYAGSGTADVQLSFE